MMIPAPVARPMRNPVTKSLTNCFKACPPFYRLSGFILSLWDILLDKFKKCFCFISSRYMYVLRIRVNLSITGFDCHQTHHLSNMYDLRIVQFYP